MIPPQIFNLFSFLLRVGNILCIVPVAWNPKTNLARRLTPKKFELFREVTLMHACIRIFVILYHAVTIFYIDVSPREVVLALTMIAGLSYSILLICTVRSVSQANHLMDLGNAALKMNQHQMVVHKLNPTRIKDSFLVKLCWGVQGLMMITVIGTFPASLGLFSLQWKLYWALDIFSIIPGFSILFSLIMTWAILLETLYMGFIFTVVFALSRVSCAWMKLNVILGPVTSRKPMIFLNTIALAYNYGLFRHGTEIWFEYLLAFSRSYPPN